MIPYYLLIGIPMLLSLLNYGENNRILNKRFPLLVFFTGFIILLSLRSVNCGVDLVNYRDKFQMTGVISFKSLFDLSLIEPGYKWFASVCKMIGINFQVFLFLCALISVVPIMLLYLKETNHNLVTMALFITIAPFSLFFSGLRQSIAIALGVVGYMMCKKNKLILFLLVAFLAYLFHQSAIILLFMYPLTHIKITKKWILPIAVLYVVFMIFNKQIFEFLLGFNQKYENRYTVSETGSYTFLLLLLMMTIYAFVMLKDDATEVFGLRNLMVLALFIQCFAPFNIVAMRVNYYYLIFIPIAIPKIIDNCKSCYKQVAVISSFVFVSFFVFWFFKEAYTGEDFLQIFPYIPFWEG